MKVLARETSPLVALQTPTDLSLWPLASGELHGGQGDLMFSGSLCDYFLTIGGTHPRAYLKAFLELILTQKSKRR